MSIDLSRNKSNDIGMKIYRNDIKKVIYLLDKVGELSIEETIEKLGFNKSKVESIFSILIENEDVIDLSSKTGISIAKKRISSYKSLSLNNPNISSSKSKNIIRGVWMAIAGIALVIGLITDGFGLFERIRENQSKTKNTTLKESSEQKNQNDSRIDSTSIKKDTLNIE